MAAIKVAIQRMFKPSACWMIPMVCGLPLSLEAAQQADCYQSYSERDLVAAQQSCQELAEQNDARAAFILATIYYQKGNASGDQRGIFWDKIAAENGHAEASYRLALAYQLGQGVELDNQKAVRWYTQAAQAHHAKAQRSLGAMYEGGYGVKQNLQQAYAWYKRAAAQGLPDAQLRLGTLFFEGRGVKADRVQAQHWIRKSAEGGNHNAQMALGVMLAEIDPQDSVRWYQRSADQGNVSAKQNLALVYFSGQGVSRDLTKALALVDEAIEAGNYSAKPLRAQILAEMSPEVQAEAQNTVAETVSEATPEVADVQAESVVAANISDGENEELSQPVPSAENNFVVTVPDKVTPAATEPETSVARADQGVAALAMPKTPESDRPAEVIAAVDNEPLRSEIREQTLSGETSAVKIRTDVAGETLTLASVQIDAETISQVTESEPPAASAEQDAVAEPVMDEVTVTAKPVASDASAAEPVTAEVSTEIKSAEPFENPVPPVLEKEPGPFGMEADDWLMKQPSDRYVIQLTNGEYKEGMEKYIRRVGLKDVDGWHFYRTQRDAGLYYVLVYGEFETVAAAKKALDGLPRKARRSHWVRQYSTLQKLYRTPGSLPSDN